MKPKKLVGIILALCLLFALSPANVALAADSAAITISGAGVDKPVSFTLEQLKGMNQVSYNYSTVNNYPTAKLLMATGVTLKDLLDRAGIKSSATLLKISGADGYAATFTVQELLRNKRYYYPDVLTAGRTGASEVPALIALKRTDGDDGKGLDASRMQEISPTLIMGQIAVTEQTNPSFVDNLYSIEVLTDTVGQWPAPTASPQPGAVAAGTEVTLSASQTSNKIYYTTDGSTPTRHSTMYNISTGWQPELNKPIPLSGSVTIKAIAVGYGRRDSAVATFSYSIGGAGGGFTDLGNHEWARSAVNALAQKQIINGMSNNQFAPSGSLTRGQFAKIMVLAMGHSATTTANNFSDVAASAWYAPYVAKAAESGLMQGAGGAFRPEDSVSKEEMVAVVVRAMGNRSTAEALDGSGLTDYGYGALTNVSTWARGYLEQAEKDGLIEHGHMATMSNGKYSFAGKSPATRAEAAVIVYNMIQKSGL
jgi:hypothetical protein